MKQLSDIVKAAVDAIWLSYDADTMQRGFAILEQEAKNGDADALCFMGRCYLGPQYVWCGGGFPENDYKGLQLIAQSVEQGSPAGILCAMRAGLPVDNTPISLKEAFENIKVQADEGDIFCSYLTANAYFWGDILLIYPEIAENLKHIEDKDAFENAYNSLMYPIAAPYYERTFEGGLSSGFGNYQSIFQSGLAFITKEKVSEYLRRLAMAGSPVCSCDYSLYLIKECDRPDEAFKYMQYAYDKGHLPAAYPLALFYANGTGTQTDMGKSFELLKIAANDGQKDAYFLLGNLYFEGKKGVEQDFEEAMRWLRRAYGVDANWRAAAEMGVMYHNGWGVPADDNTAFRYLHALELRNVLGQLWMPLDGMVFKALGYAYGFGKGVEKDAFKARTYLEKAIAFGNREAIDLLSKLDD